MLKLRESMFLEKQQTIEDLKVGFEQERREAAARVEDRISALVSDNSNITTVSHTVFYYNCYNFLS